MTFYKCIFSLKKCKVRVLFNKCGIVQNSFKFLYQLLWEYISSLRLEICYDTVCKDVCKNKTENGKRIE